MYGSFSLTQYKSAPLAVTTWPQYSTTEELVGGGGGERLPPHFHTHHRFPALYIIWVSFSDIKLPWGQWCSREIQIAHRWRHGQKVNTVSLSSLCWSVLKFRSFLLLRLYTPIYNKHCPNESIKCLSLQHLYVFVGVLSLWISTYLLLAVVYFPKSSWRIICTKGNPTTQPPQRCGVAQWWSGILSSLLYHKAAKEGC